MTSSQWRPQHSPYAGDASNRSTTLANASGEVSARNASISCGVGGSPVKSKVARRIKVRLSAGGEGLSRLDSSLARMKLSIAALAQCLFLTLGGVTWPTG